MNDTTRRYRTTLVEVLTRNEDDAEQQEKLRKFGDEVVAKFTLIANAGLRPNALTLDDLEEAIDLMRADASELEGVLDGLQEVLMKRAGRDALREPGKKPPRAH